MLLTDDHLYQRIRQAVLTPGQRVIADYILRHQNRIGCMTCLGLAQEIGVSDASVIRFARAIGYQGFSDLKTDLHRRRSQDMLETQVGEYAINERLNIQTERYADLDLSKELPKLLLSNVERSIVQNPYQAYSKTIDALHNGQRVVVLGLRGGKGPAIYFGRMLQFLMDEVQVITEATEGEASLLQGLRKTDTVIAISYARYYKCDKILADLIQQRRAILCTLADSTRSPFAKIANTVLLVETKHMGFHNSAVGTVSVLEYLATMLCWRYPQTYQARLAERAELQNSFYFWDET